MKNTCMIEGKEQKYNLCSKNKEGYNDIKHKLQYLGNGYISKVGEENFAKDEVTAMGTNKDYHFWIWKD